MSSHHEEMYKLLRDHSTKKYYIEYNGFLSNHISHGLLALERLKAPLDHAHKFIQWHGQEKLEDAEKHKLRESAEDPRPESVDQLVGKRQSFYYLYDHYFSLLKDRYDNSLDRLVSAEFPKIANGLVGSALHGMIHLGYGYASREDWFVCEGLAYLHHSSMPLTLSSNAPDISTIGHGSCDILDVIRRVQDDSALTQYMLEAIKAKDVAELITSDFQRKTRVLFFNKGDVLAKYAHLIGFPAGLKAKEITLKQVPQLAKWITDCAIVVYAIAKNPNDFFLLHGVTGAWSVKNVLPLMTDIRDVLAVTRTFLCALIAAYLAQNRPGLQTQLLKENDGLSHSWDDLIQRAISHDQYEEEHIYKLVQVCKGMSEEADDQTMESIYRLAANHCVSNPLTFSY